MMMTMMMMMVVRMMIIIFKLSIVVRVVDNQIRPKYLKKIETENRRDEILYMLYVICDIRNGIIFDLSI